VPIPAGVEAVALVAALIAAFEMTAEDCRAAHFDGGHHTPLFRGHRCAMVLSISFAVATEHVRHFQPLGGPWDGPLRSTEEQCASAQ
jgi:hypothetical protein